MNQQMFPVFLGLMGVSAAAWFFMTKRLYQQLKSRHPDIYESLGSPTPRVKRGGHSNILVIRFILFDYKQQTDDPAVQRLCQGLRSVLSIFIICLLGCVVLLVNFSVFEVHG